jgi:hypothetical protein
MLMQGSINVEFSVSSTAILLAWYSQRHFSTSIQLSNPTKIQRLFNVDGQLKFNVVSMKMNQVS